VHPFLALDVGALVPSTASLTDFRLCVLDGKLVVQFSQISGGWQKAEPMRATGALWEAVRECARWKQVQDTPVSFTHPHSPTPHSHSPLSYPSATPLNSIHTQSPTPLNPPLHSFSHSTHSPTGARLELPRSLERPRRVPT
jgi:hypothetical protein